MVLPDHMHCLMKLPDGEIDYPLRLRLSKSYFTRRLKENAVEKHFISYSEKRTSYLAAQILGTCHKG